jgi:hypothetical protein
MNTRKTVYNKLFKEETQLAKHEVELAIADKLKLELKNYGALISKYGSQLDNLYVPIRVLEKAINELKGTTPEATKIAQDLRKQEDLISKEIDLVTKKINQTKSDLGINIDINEIVDLSNLQSSNTISSRIQNDAASFVKYVNTLQKPTI